MHEKKDGRGRRTLKNRVRGLRAVRIMRPEAQNGFDDLWKSEIKVYCYPDDPSGNADVQLEPGYGQIELRDDDRFDVELSGVIVKTGCRYDELETFLTDYGQKHGERGANANDTL